MEFDFDVARIEVRPSASFWGPYSFNFKGRLPDPAGDPIADVTVKSTLNGVETTTDLIDGTPALSSPVVQVKFKYPGDAAKGKHVLKFMVTLQGGGVNEFVFGYVEVI